MSRLDYGNAILAGLPGKVIRKLQSVQNAAARIVQRLPKSHSVTPVLKDLHWLKVDMRIKYKVLLMVYKALHGEAPVYIQDLLKLYEPTRSLRSANRSLLCVPKVKTVTYGNRIFSKVAADLWNELEENVKSSPSVASFKRRLKTYLFKKCYCNV
jgi:hypothetical protein